MRILPVTQQVSFRNFNNKYIYDVKNHSYALKEFADQLPKKENQ